MKFLWCIKLRSKNLPRIIMILGTYSYNVTIILGIISHVFLLWCLLIYLRWINYILIITFIYFQEVMLFLKIKNTCNSIFICFYFYWFKGVSRNSFSFLKVILLGFLLSIFQRVIISSRRNNIFLNFWVLIIFWICLVI